MLCCIRIAFVSYWKGVRVAVVLFSQRITSVLDLLPSCAILVLTLHSSFVRHVLQVYSYCTCIVMEIFGFVLQPVGVSFVQFSCLFRIV